MSMENIIKRDEALVVFNLPILLTFFRLFLIPVLVMVYFSTTHWKFFICGAIFTFACFTDWLDGYLARKFHQTTAFGTFLDPVADKLIVTVALVLIVHTPHLSGTLIPAIIIVARELTISALREWMSEMGKKTSIAVSNLGKLKTLIQMLALGTLLTISPTTENWIFILGHFLLYLAAILTIVSMLIYMKLAWNELEKP